MKTAAEVAEFAVRSGMYRRDKKEARDYVVSQGMDEAYVAEWPTASREWAEDLLAAAVREAKRNGWPV